MFRPLGIIIIGKTLKKVHSCFAVRSQFLQLFVPPPFFLHVACLIIKFLKINLIKVMGRLCRHVVRWSKTRHSVCIAQLTGATARYRSIQKS